MADQVQATLDRMVPALRDLLDRGIFTESEIKAIVSRRRESEYLIRRISPRKDDYKRYIEAEKNLEKLRKLRKKIVLARQEAKEREEQLNDNDGENDHSNKDNSGKMKGQPKSSMGDASIVQNIHLLYVRAKRKWQEDLSWHLQHAEFAKEVKSYQMLSRIYAEALQLHPRNESLWIEAASHEYFGYESADESDDMSGGGSIKSARVLLQRGLRINPNANSLWLQSFCLELHYIQKLRGRREVLQLQAAKLEDSDSDNIESSLKLPIIIFKNAIKAIPNDATFRIQFIEQCKLFPETQFLIDLIMESVEKDFKDVEDAWIARARYLVENDNSDDVIALVSNESNGSECREISTRKRKRDDKKNHSKDEKILNILNDATDTIHTSKMFLQSLEFLRWYSSSLKASLEDEDDIVITKQRMSAVLECCLQMINKARSKVTVSPELAIEMSSCLLYFGLASQSLKLIKTMTESVPQCRQDANCWLKLAEISELVNIDENGNSDIKASCTILRKAMKSIPLHDVGHVRIVSKFLMNLLANDQLTDELFSTYEKLLILNKKVVKENQISLATITLAYLRRIAETEDVNLLRKVYSKFLYNTKSHESSSNDVDDPDVMQKIFDECILVESKQMKMSGFQSKRGKRQTQHLLHLYDAAFTYFLNVNDRLSHLYHQKRREISS